MKKVAVVLLNFGGPDTQESVQPFLLNMFKDPAILRVPRPLHFCLARLVSMFYAGAVRRRYARLGRHSPILQNTKDQAGALEKVLNETSSGPQFKIFIAMRYWHPFALESARKVKAFAPDEIVLLPLYPQYSTTTAQSGIENWQNEARQAGLNIPTRITSCTPQERGFIRALAESTRPLYAQAKEAGSPRILFSAHGLPERIIRAGDPYQTQCGMTAEALRQELAIKNLDSVLCFQSRVGPMKWIGPSTDDEVRRAGRDRVSLIVVPISFVSECSETLVDIDIGYRALAQRSGVPYFARAPAVGTSRNFIYGLAQIIRDVRTPGENDRESGGGGIHVL